MRGNDGLLPKDRLTPANDEEKLGFAVFLAELGEPPARAEEDNRTACRGFSYPHFSREAPSSGVILKREKAKYTGIIG